MAKRSTKTTKSKKNVFRGIATLLAGLIVLGAVGALSSWITGWTLTGEPNMSKWQQSDSKTDNTTSRTVAISNTGTKMQNGAEYDMPTGFAFLSASTPSKTEQYAPGGEITLSASLSNEYINGKFDWATVFKNPESEWAKGKSSDYYVGLEPIDGGRQVKVKYLAKFSEQIILTATLQGTESSDSCTIDCVKAVEISSRPEFGSTDFSDDIYIDIYHTLGEGTVLGNFEFKQLTMQLKTSFVSAFKNYLNFPVTVKSYISNTGDNYEVSANSGIAVEGPTIEYSMFIEGFDDYDQDHKDAIYYAWYKAHSDMGGYSNNIDFDISITYTYAGTAVKELIDSEMGMYLTGSCFGSGVEPSVTLNKNVTF